MDFLHCRRGHNQRSAVSLHANEKGAYPLPFGCHLDVLLIGVAGDFDAAANGRLFM